MKKLTENLIQQRVKTCTTGLDKVQRINVTGRELHDVALLRKMTGVEVLSLSVNHISSLADFQCCKNLRELYLRNNKIKNINEIFYLKGLPKLELLMLSQNPCAEDPLYRMTVIKNLQNLKELDGITITVEERRHALKEGEDINASHTILDSGELFILESPPSQRISTSNNQKMKGSTDSNTDLRKTNTYKVIKRQSNLGDSAKEGVQESSQTLPVHENTLQGKQCKSKGKSLIPTTPELKDMNAALCKACGNTVPECVRINLQNSNLLSATLSIIKELDYASLNIVSAEVNSLLSAFKVNFLCQRQPIVPRNGGMIEETEI